MRPSPWPRSRAVLVARLLPPYRTPGATPDARRDARLGQHHLAKQVQELLLTTADPDGGNSPTPPAACDPTPPAGAVTPGAPHAEAAPSQT